METVLEAFGIISIVLIGVLMIAIIHFLVASKNKEEIRKKLDLIDKEKVLIAKWIHSQGTPDEDGYYGTYIVPEDIMEVYKELYPDAWE